MKMVQIASHDGVQLLAAMNRKQTEIRRGGRATAKDFRRIALSLPNTTAAPHFERTAFKVRRIYATLAPDGRSANVMLTPDEQALKCEVAPEAFSRIPNAWGARGATTAKLSALTSTELRDALVMAWRHAVPKRR